MGFDFSFYVYVIRRWLWLVIIASFVVGATVYFILGQREDLYETRALINVGNSLYSPNPDFNEVRVGQELAETYAYLVDTDSIREATAMQLGSIISVQDIDRIVNTRIIPNTSLFEIIVIYHDPELAADIANTISEQLIIQSPTNLTPQLETQIELSQSQISLLNTQIEYLLEQSVDLNIRIDEAEAEGNTALVDTLSGQLGNIIQQINQATATIASFSNNITEIEQRANSISIQDRASIPFKPINQHAVLFTAIAILGTATFVSGGAIFLSAIDVRLQSESYIKYNMGITIQGSVCVSKQNYGLFAQDNSEMFESYQILRTNLLYRSTRDTPCYIFTSPSSIEQTLAVIANLTTAIANSGFRTLLIDGNMRNSNLHDIFGIRNDVGLRELLQIEDLEQINVSTLFDSKLLKTTEMENFYFIPCGSTPSNPIRLLESSQMSNLLEKLKSGGEFDFILINTPPMLVYGDTATFAAHTHLEVLLIVEYAKTKAEDVTLVVEQLQQVNANLAGAIYIKNCDG